MVRKTKLLSFLVCSYKSFLKENNTTPGKIVTKAESNAKRMRRMLKVYNTILDEWNYQCEILTLALDGVRVCMLFGDHLAPCMFS